MQILSYRCLVLSTLVLLIWTQILWAAGLERPIPHPTAPAVAKKPALRPANSGSATLQAGLPDLQIQSAQWSIPPAAGQQLGRNSILNIHLHNSGKVPSPATQLTISCEALTGGICPAAGVTRDVSPMGINQGYGIAWPDFSTAVWTAGKYRVVLSLDPRNQVRESNELNNKLILNVNIASPRPAVSLQQNPKPKAALLQGMTASQFQSLAPSTLLQVGEKTVPKSEIVKALDASRAAAAARLQVESQTFAAEQKKRSDQLQEQQKMAVKANNIAVKKKFASLHAVAVNSVTASLSVSAVPQITEVHAANNILTPGYWVAIKGTHFGDIAGQVTLVGDFPGGSVPLTIDEWYNDAIMVEVPMIMGVRDQTALLEILTSDNQKATSQVSFHARLTYQQIPASLITVADCSHNASFHNACKMGTDFDFSAEHQNLPDQAFVNTSGTDTYTIKPLKNGWTPKYTGHGKCTVGYTFQCAWSTNTNPETVTIMTDEGPVTLATLSSSYTEFIGAIGPTGVPMQ